MGTTNILDLNNRVSALEKAVSGGDSAQANKKDIATEFSATTAYTAGCFVYYQGKLYQFNTDHAAGAWDSTDVVEANVTDQIVSNKAAIDGLTASDVAYDNTTSGLTATDVQGAVDELTESYPASNVMLSDGVTSVEDALEGKKLTTVSGTIIADLVTAWSGLTDRQKENCIKFKVNGHYMVKYSSSVFRRTTLSSTKLLQEYIAVNENPSFAQYEYTLGQASATTSTLTVTSWEFTYIEL